LSTRKKNTFIHLAFSYTNSAIAFVNGILIVPIYLNYIDTTSYGAWLATGNLLTWLTIADPGTSNVTIQRIAKTTGKPDRAMLPYQVSSSIVVSFLASLVCLIAGLIFAGYVGAILNVKDTAVIAQTELAFQIAMIAVAIALFEYSIYAILVGLQYQFYTGMSRTIGRLIGIIVSLTMVVKGFGIMGIAVGVLITNSLSLSFNIIFLVSKNIQLRWSLRYFKAYVKIFSVTFFSRVFSTLYENIDLILVSRILNPTVVAQLEITRRPMKYLQGFLVAPSQSLMPTLSNYFGENKPKMARTLIEKLIVGFFCVFFITGLGFMMFNESLVKFWVGEQYYIGTVINTILSIGIVISMFNYILSNINTSMGNIKGASYATIVNSIAGLLLMIILGNQFGLIGIIIAPIVTMVFTQLWYYLNFIDRQINFSQTLWLTLGKVIAFGLLAYGVVYLGAHQLLRGHDVNYLQLIIQSIILIGGILIIYISSIHEFRILLFNDVLKFFSKKK
jgi:O-antigen/teichoic acid export membrane protein